LEGEKRKRGEGGSEREGEDGRGERKRRGKEEVREG
jgi:hypothetical protein